jgi:hypothetical protein
MFSEIVFIVSVISYFYVEKVYKMGIIISIFVSILNLLKAGLIGKTLTVAVLAIHIGSHLKDLELYSNISFLVLAIFYPIFSVIPSNSKKISNRNKTNDKFTPVANNSSSTPVKEVKKINPTFTPQESKVIEQSIPSSEESQNTVRSPESKLRYSIVQDARETARERELKRRKEAAMRISQSPSKSASILSGDD